MTFEIRLVLGRSFIVDKATALALVNSLGASVSYTTPSFFLGPLPVVRLFEVKGLTHGV